MENLKIYEIPENGKLDKEKSQKLTGYPSIDKAHEKHFSKDVLDYEMPKVDIFDYLYSRNMERLERPAINYFDNRISYTEFFDNSLEVAKALTAAGVKKGDIITVILPNMPEAFYILLAASKIGATASFVDPRYGEKAIEHKINDADSKLVIAYDGKVKTLNPLTKKYNELHVLDKVGNIIQNTDVKQVVGVKAINSASLTSFIKNDFLRNALKNTLKDSKHGKSDFKDFESWKSFISKGQNSKALFPKYEANQPVAAVSSGGSTGTPKTILLTNENIVGATMQVVLTKLFPEDSRWYDIMPPSIAYGLADGSILPFALGNEVRLNPDPTALSLKTPNQLWMVEDFVRFDPHSMTCAPNHVFQVLNSKEWKENAHSVVNFVVGGDSLNKKQVERANKILKDIKRPDDFETIRFYPNGKDEVKINTGYGESEGTGANSVAPSNEMVREGTVGLTLPHEIVTTFKKNEDGSYTELKYIPNDQIDSVFKQAKADLEAEKENEQIGEICVQGPNVMPGYLNNPEETSVALVKHQDGKVWLHTGDLGFIDEDGYIHFIDRIKYVSVGHDGFKVAPIEIENVILEDERIDACKAVVFADPENERGTVIKVYYTLIDSAYDNEVEEIEELANLRCARELADYKCPVAYEALEKLPITASGKIDVMTLRREAEEKAKVKTLVKE